LNLYATFLLFKLFADLWHPNLDAVVKIDVLLRDVWDIPVMEEVFKRRFNGTYPARKTISTEFAHIGGPKGLKCQIDAIAYRTNKL
jgi:enamine deaminase RidA (YjgF/YER057c/UK114 family)